MRWATLRSAHHLERRGNRSKIAGAALGDYISLPNYDYKRQVTKTMVVSNWRESEIDGVPMSFIFGKFLVGDVGHRRLADKNHQPSETAFSESAIGSVSGLRQFEEMVLPRIACGGL